MSNSTETIEVVCPEGHLLNAPVAAMGRTLPCPICKAPVQVTSPHRNPVTDSRVMRILGDADIPRDLLNQPASAPSQRDKLSDTGVMRILGDFAATPSVDVAELPATRPCPVCSSDVSESASVCQHCDCYIGVSPDYLRTLTQQPGNN